MADLYEVLDLDRGADLDAVKRAYRRKAREHHPDAGGDEERFKEVTHAYEVLSDPQRRRRYDRTGDDGTPSTRGAGDPFGFGGAGFGGIGDVIDAFFGSGFSGAGRGAGRSEAGRDVLVTVELTLEEVASGTERTVEVEVARSCDACAGSGARDGAPASRCTTCGGAGAVRRTVRTAFGQMATAVTCPDCGGDGHIVVDPCTTCRGEGRRVVVREVEAPIPPGLEDGDRIPLRGEGEAGRRGAPPGDLYLQMRVLRHAVFGRRGRDLTAELVVPFAHAALGARVPATALDGTDLAIDLPAGVQPGTVVTVRRAGLPARGGGRPGDLHLTVQVEVPIDLSDTQRALIAELAEASGEPIDAPRPVRFARLRDAFQR